MTRSFIIDKEIQAKKLKNFNKIQSKTKAGQKIKSGDFVKEIKYKIQRKNVKSISEYEGDEIYIISGIAKIAANTKIINKKYHTHNFQDKKINYTIRGKKNLTKKQLRNLVFYKTQEYYKVGRDGESNNEVVGVGFRVVNPENINLKRMKLYENDYLKIKSLEKDEVKVSTNCVFDYLLNELQQQGYKMTFDKLKNKFNSFLDNDIFKNGITLDELENFLIMNFKKLNFYVIGIDNKIIKRKVTENYASSKKLCFKILNNHLYPITSKKGQELITKSHNEKKNLFDEDKLKFNKWLYMDKINFEFKDGYNYILNEKLNYNDFKTNLINETGYMIEYFNNKCFKHPVINCLIYDYNEYHSRKETYENLNLNSIIPFKNESYPAIAKLYLENINSLITSYYNKESYYYLTTYEPKPIIDDIKEVNNNYNIKAVDISKHYTSIYYNNFQHKNFYIPIYDYHNYVKKYEGEKITFGEYYINLVEYKGVRFGGYFIHSFVIKKLLKMGIIQKDDIKYFITTKQIYKPTNYKKFVDSVYTKIKDEQIFKKLNNMLNGSLNDKKKIIDKEYFFTNENCSLTYLLNDTIKNDMKWDAEIDVNYNCWFSRWNETENYNNTSSYYRSVLSCSILELMKLINKINGDIIKVKTDAVYYIGEDFKYDEYDNLLNSLGKYKEEDTSGKYFYENRYKNLEFKKYICNDEKKIILGGGGYGKSYKVIEKNDINDKILFLTPTNSAKNNLVEKTLKIKGDLGEWQFKTLSSMFDLYNYRTNIKNLNFYKKVIVDEVFMVSSKYLRILTLHNNILLLGDEKQLPPIENNDIDILNTYIGNSFKIERLKYNKNKSRYDEETYNIINNFINSGYMFNKLNMLNTIDDKKIYDFYICRTNKTRQKYIKKVCDFKHSDKKEYDFYYQGKREKYKIDIDTPIIATSNELKKYNIFNNWTGYIKKINNDTILISDGEDKELNINEFKNNFLPFYASTVHKVQGCKITTDYAILECYDNLTSSNSIYTALTRCENYKQIHIYKCGSSIKINKYNIHNYKEEYFKTNLKKSMNSIFKIEYKNKVEYATKPIKNKNILSCKKIYEIKCDNIYLNKILNRLKNNAVVIETIKNKVFITPDKIKCRIIILKSQIRLYKVIDGINKKQETKYKDENDLKNKIEKIKSKYDIININNKSELSL